MTLATTDSAPAVAADRVTKVIDERAILADLSFDVAQGAYVALLGANGAGKSTLLRILATLTPPTRGELRLFGASSRPTAALRSRIGMIGHQTMLYRDLSPVENLVLFGRLYGVPDPQRRARELLDYVFISPRRDDPVRTFSRGMAQRVAIARALTSNPDLLLADEPFSGLDAPSRRLVEELLAQLHGAGKAIILANHDVEQSLALAQRAIVLRQGSIAIFEPTAALTPDDVLAEVSRR
jgi:heme exporter protein A